MSEIKEQNTNVENVETTNQNTNVETTNQNTNVENVETTNKNKSFLRYLASAICGLIVGLATVFGISTVQLNNIKNALETTYNDVREMNELISGKEYIKAIEKGKHTITSIQNAIGEVKESVNIIKERSAEYKKIIEEIKINVDNKNYTDAAADAAKLGSLITENIPEDKLTGAAKEIYDITKQIIDDINAKKYDPVIDLVKKLVDLVSKDENKDVSTVTE